MSGPWENYAPATAEAKPWEKYGASDATDPAPLTVTPDASLQRSPALLDVMQHPEAMMALAPQRATILPATDASLPVQREGQPDFSQSQAASEAMLGSLATGVSVLPLAMGGAANLVGMDGTRDHFFDSTTSLRNLGHALQADAQGKSRAGATLGSTAAIVPQLLAPELLAGQIVSGGSEPALSALDKGADLPTAEKLMGLGTALNAAANLLPAGLGNNPVVRGITGGAINTAAGYAIPALEHAAAPDYTEAPTLDGAITQGGIGAILAAALGHGAPAARTSAFDSIMENVRNMKFSAPGMDAPLGLPENTPINGEFRAGARPTPPPSPGEVRVAPTGEAFTPAQGKQVLAEAIGQALREAPAGLPEPTIAVDRQGTAKTTADRHAELTQPAPEDLATALGLTPGTLAAQAKDARTAREGALIPPKGLPAPAIAVDQAGTAMTSADFMRRAQETRQAAEERRALGITPDIERSQGVRWSKQAQAAQAEADRQARLKELDDAIAAREAQNLPARGRNAKPDETTDDALTFLAKQGGLERRAFVQQGVDPVLAKARENLTRGGASRPLFRAQGNGGMSLDDAARVLWQHGYLPEQDNQAALDLILHGVNQGTPTYSIHRHPQDDLLAMQQARADADQHTVDTYADVPFSFAGERARTADRGALEQAKAMEAMGRDSVPDRYGNQPGSPEDTHMATGWHRGVDGKWRFEIDDSQASLHKDRMVPLHGGGIAPQAFESVSYQRRPDGAYDLDLIPANPKQVSDIRHLQRIPADALPNLLPRDVAERIARGEGEDDLMGADLGDAKRIRGGFQFGGLNAMPLDLVFDHPALFKAYPELANVTVRVNPDMRGLGSYSARSNMIEIRNPRDYPRDGDSSLKSVLLHEIQHAIQNHEGFARGGSSAEARTLPEFEQALRQQMAERGGELPPFDQVKPSKPDEIKAAQAVYRRLAGEVEARNTQRRLPMDAEQRRAVPPTETADVPRHQQIVRFNADRAMREEPSHADQQAIDRYNARLSDYLGAAVHFTPAADVPDAARRALAAFDDAFGGRTLVIRNDTPDTLDLNGVTLRDGVRLVNEDATSPLLTVAGHEMLHQLRKDAPDLYRELVDEVRRQGRLDSYEAVLTERAKASGEQGKTFRRDEVEEELTADATGDALSDPDFIERLAQQNPGLFRRLADRLRDFFDSLLQRLRRSLGSSPFLADVEAFRDKLADVLERYATRQQGKAATHTPADPAFQRVFHGTPHTVDKFSLQKIGTGEGAQAYGWGMYFASEKAIAEHYRERLSGKARETLVDGRPARDLPQAQWETAEQMAVHGWTPDRFIDHARQKREAQIESAERAGNENRVAALKDLLREEVDAAEALRGRELTTRAPGNLYHVEVPEDHDLLDYDKPISAQPAKVRQAMQAILADERIDASTRAEWEHAAPDQRTGKRFYNLLSGADGVAGERGASELLNEYGIPGLRYLDGTSRAKGEGSANYVIWDEGAIGAPEHALSRKPVDDQTQTPAFRRWFGDSKVVDAEGKPLVVYHGTQADIQQFKGPTYFSESPKEASAYTFAGTLAKREKALAKQRYQSAEDPKMAGQRVPYAGIIGDIAERGTVHATDQGVARVNDDGTVTVFTDLVERKGSYDSKTGTVQLVRGDGRGAFRTLVKDSRESIDRAFPPGVGMGGNVTPVYLSIQNPKHMDAHEANRFGARLGGTPDAWRAAVAELEAQGYDGIVTESDDPGFWMSGDAQPQHWIPFRPEQIKSATGNRGTFDPEVPSILFSRKPSPGSTTPADLPSRRPGESQAAYARRVTRKSADQIKLATALAKRQKTINRQLLRAKMAGEARALATADAALAEARKAFDKTPDVINYASVHQFETGQPIADADFRAFAQTMQAGFDQRIAEIHRLAPDALKSLIEHYMPHLYQDSGKAIKWYQGVMGKRPLDGDKSFLKQRTWPTLKEAMASGLKPISPNPVDWVLMKYHQMDKFIGLLRYREELQKRGWILKMEPGQRAPEGFARVDNPAFQIAGGLQGHYVVPEGMARDLNTLLAPGLEQYGAWRTFRAAQNAMVSANLGFSAFHASFTSTDNVVTHFGVGLNRLAMGDLAGGIRHVLEAIPTILTGPLHGGRLNREWQGMPANALDRLSAKVPAIDRMLFGSAMGDPHVMALLDLLEQGGARYKNAPDLVSYNNALPSIARGLRRLQAPGYLADRADDLRRQLALDGPLATGGKVVWEGAKGIGRAFSAVGELGSYAIHHVLVPNQKMAARITLLKMELDRYAEQLGKRRGDYAGIVQVMHPDVARQLASEVVDRVDFRLGQMIYDNFFVPKIARQVAQAVMLAPGWLVGGVQTAVGGVRDLPRLVKPAKLVAPLDRAGTITDAHRGRIGNNLTSLAALLLIVGGANAVFQYLMTGEGPRELRDLVAPRTGRKNADDTDERITSPNYLKDHYELTAHPLATLGHKLHPSLRMLWDIAHNEDYFGNMIRDPHHGVGQQAEEIAKYMLKGMLPLSVQNVKEARANGDSVGQMAAGFFGFNPAPASLNRSAFQAFVAKGGAKGWDYPASTPTEAAYQERRRAAEQALRTGQTPDFTGLEPRDVMNLKRKVRTPTPELQFDRLALADKLDAYDLATPAERQRYHLTEILQRTVPQRSVAFRRLPTEEREALLAKLSRVRRSAER